MARIVLTVAGNVTSDRTGRQLRLWGAGDGELSGVIPRYLYDCWEAVRDGTKYAETALSVITVPGKASCGDCGAVFAVDSADLRCPECGGAKLTPISGRDMTISEIEAY